MTRAIVVGSGPNGLAAAVRLAQAGLAVRVLEAADRPGGGTRTGELTLPGLRHDECSAIHPTGITSPAFGPGGSLGLEIEWAQPEIALAHVLDAGGVTLQPSLTETAAALGADGASWRRLFEPLATHFAELADDVYRPWPRPRHPLLLARFGSAAMLPATVLAQRWRTEEARALWAGIAAHAITSLSAPLSSAPGVLLAAAGHAGGWPVAVGGSQAITEALIRRLEELGGVVETGVRVRDLDQTADLVLLDTTPQGAAEILGDRLPTGVARAWRRFRFGPAAYKVDFAVREGVPWSFVPARRAGTVHVGGTFAEIAAAERAVAAGRLPARPFVLVAQQYLADPSRAKPDLVPIWAYAHVPHGHRGDLTATIEEQIERFAPGFRNRIVARSVRGPVELERHNPNYVGGDIAAGSVGGTQLVFRPRPALNPYATGVPGVFLCSASTPPGPGVHGMCGVRAAEAALASLTR